MCQGLGPKKHDEISEIDRIMITLTKTASAMSTSTAGACEKTLLLPEPWPSNPAAETAFEPLIWCSESLSSRGSSSTEECVFHRHRYELFHHVQLYYVDLYFVYYVHLIHHNKQKWQKQLLLCPPLLCRPRRRSGCAARRAPPTPSNTIV